MRCTRCDRPAVPQSVGYTPQGLLVFGWCLDCMHDHDCVFVEAGRFGKRPRRNWAKRLGAGLRREGAPLPAWIRLGAVDPGLAAHRLRFLRRIALAIEACAGIFLGMGAAALIHPRPAPPSGPLPNGRVSFLIVGSIALAIMGIVIWWTARGPSDPGPRLAPAKTGPKLTLPSAAKPKPVPRRHP
jgi:hypothetical protein